MMRITLKKQGFSFYRRQLFTLLCLLVFLPTLLIAEEAAWASARRILDQAGFPENDETRRLLSDAILAPAYPAVETDFQLYRQLSDKRLVQFELRRAARSWYLIFRNQRQQETFDSFPVWGRGTWIIKKNLSSGVYEQAKIFLQDDEESFIRLFPANGGRSRLDIHLYGRQLGNDILLPISFEKLLFSPFARIISLTEQAINWQAIFPDASAYGYQRIRNFIDHLALYSERIVEVSDAAIDANGRNVLIETASPVGLGTVTTQGGFLAPGQTGLNCSGYVKWIADGLLAGWKGNFGAGQLAFAPLRRSTTDPRENPWNASRTARAKGARIALDSLLRDPYFGLDWNRNLAVLLEEARLGQRLSPSEIEALDSGAIKSIPYQKNLGYHLYDLDTVLYHLAAERPGAIYFATINSRFLPPATTNDPHPLPLHQYWHLSILAPWFDDGSENTERGRFHVAVLDVGDVGETLLRNPSSNTIPHFIDNIQRNATRYARLGLDETGKAISPDVMVHLLRTDLPFQFEAAYLPEAPKESPGL